MQICALSQPLGSLPNQSSPQGIDGPGLTVQSELLGTMGN
uniref:Uncharacterized protein n=1 Tax=Anguilla anguilla TaxID=7936 RepID=A0A0E9PNK5_ANGAN